MSEILQNPQEREVLPSQDNILEQARSATLTAVFEQGKQDFQKVSIDKNPAENDHQKTRTWMGMMTSRPDGVYNDIPLQGVDSDNKPNGKNMVLAISKDGVRASMQGLDFGAGYTSQEIISMKGKKGSMVTVELKDKSLVTIPISVLQEAHLLTHSDAHLAGLTGKKQEVTAAYIHSITNPTNPKLENIKLDDLKEVAKDTKCIKPESVVGYMNKISGDIRTSPTYLAMTPEQRAIVDAKLTQIDALRDRIGAQVVTTSEDMSEMLRLLNSKEITGVEVSDIKAQLSESATQLAQITNQMLSISSESEQWKRLNVLKQDLNMKMSELQLQRNLLEKSTDKFSKVDEFFERAQNGEYSAEMIDQMNAGLKEGNIDKIIEQALKEMAAQGKSPEEIEAAKKRAEAMRNKGMMLAGGAGLILLFVIMSAMKGK